MQRLECDTPKSLRKAKDAYSVSTVDHSTQNALKFMFALGVGPILLGLGSAEPLKLSSPRSVHTYVACVNAPRLFPPKSTIMYAAEDKEGAGGGGGGGSAARRMLTSYIVSRPGESVVR